VLLKAVNKSSASGSYINRNHLAGYLEMTLALGIGLLVMVIGLVMTRSRMGNCAFVISLTLAALYWVVANGRLTRGMLLLFGSLLLVDTWVVGNFFGIERVAATGAAPGHKERH
jgi:hypothetical protein